MKSTASDRGKLLAANANKKPAIASTPSPNNTPALARQALEGALGGVGPEIMIAGQAQGFDGVDVAP